MNDKIAQRIVATLSALNNITVSGKNNLSNLVGSIGVLEEVLQILNEEAKKEENEKNN